MTTAITVRITLPKDVPFTAPWYPVRRLLAKPEDRLPRGRKAARGTRTLIPV